MKVNSWKVPGSVSSLEVSNTQSSFLSSIGDEETEDHDADDDAEKGSEKRDEVMTIDEEDKRSSMLSIDKEADEDKPKAK